MVSNADFPDLYPPAGGDPDPRVVVPMPKPRNRAQMHSDGVADLARTALRQMAGQTGIAANAPPVVSAHYVDAFCRVLMQGKVPDALNMTQMLSARGATRGDIAEQLLAAAARRLGDKWRRDTASLLEVNLAISTLRRTHVAWRAQMETTRTASVGSALFATLDGQAHTFGLALAAEHFRQNGWRVCYLPGVTQGALLETVAEKQPDIVGLTAATAADLRRLADAIRPLRALPDAPAVIVGGTAPNIDALGADALATRLDTALLAARRLIRRAPLS